MLFPVVYVVYFFFGSEPIMRRAFCRAKTLWAAVGKLLIFLTVKNFAIPIFSSNFVSAKQLYEFNPFHNLHYCV